MKFHLLACLLFLPLAARSEDSKEIFIDVTDDANIKMLSCGFRAADAAPAEAAEELDCLVKYLSDFEKERAVSLRAGHDVDPKRMKEARRYKVQAVLRIRSLTAWMTKLDTASRNP